MVTTFVPLLLFSGTMLLQRPARVTALELVAANPTRLENSADGSGGGLFWSEFENDNNVDFSISCVGQDCTYLTRDNTTVTMPCGKFKRGPGISFMYYVKGSFQTLVEATTDYPQFLVAWNDTGTTVCCSPNTSSLNNIFQDSTCYQLNVTYAPILVDTKWAPGINKWPIYGEQVVRVCPLDSNPPSVYSWKRYSITDMSELNISKDVEFEDDGRRLEISAYNPERHGGLYECLASNSLGSRKYSDSTVFYLQDTDGRYCGQRKLSKNISPSGELHYRPGEDVVLNCSFYPVKKVGQRPSWYHIDYNESARGRVKFVDSSNTRQDYRYDGKTCSWKNTLTIHNFSKELSGTYSCGYSNHIINQTLKLLLEREPDVMPLTPKPWYNWKMMVPLVLVTTCISVLLILYLVVVVIRYLT